MKIGQAMDTESQPEKFLNWNQHKPLVKIWVITIARYSSPIERTWA